MPSITDLQAGNIRMGGIFTEELAEDERKSVVVIFEVISSQQSAIIRYYIGVYCCGKVLFQRSL